MPGRNYRRGYRAELKAREELERQGYLVVRAAGSKGPVDLVAVGPDGVRLIQVRRTRRGSNGLASALRELERVPAPPGVTREAWLWRDKEGFVAKERLA
ncbi:hypothetical protein [Desulfovirgula thermocuniculi]|uniref:hypothetical protein n=1 Tax=Desulfovirgula thermocuniculi TaxID=348842 RepID=UPI000423C304|nr:hypothetical protein [Desulfovirgula thermocuniculi]